jgi:hypothetical protein
MAREHQDIVLCRVRAHRPAQKLLQRARVARVFLAIVKARVGAPDGRFRHRHQRRGLRGVLIQHIAIVGVYAQRVVCHDDSGRVTARRGHLANQLHA